MASFLVFTTLLCIWVPVHLYLSKADFVELREWIIWVKKQMDDVKPGFANLWHLWCFVFLALLEGLFVFFFSQVS